LFNLAAPIILTRSAVSLVEARVGWFPKQAVTLKPFDCRVLINLILSGLVLVGMARIMQMLPAHTNLR
jgi:hypothetical protein